jgi:hypothetical protein
MDHTILKSPKSIYEVIYPFHNVLKFCGLIVYSFDGPVEDGKIVITNFDLLIFFLAFSGHITLFVLLFFKSFSDVTSSIVLNKGNVSSIFLGVFLAIIIIIYQFYKRNELKKFLSGLNEFDKKVW